MQEITTSGSQVEPHRLSGEKRKQVLELLAIGASIFSRAQDFNTGCQTSICGRDGNAS